MRAAIRFAPFSVCPAVARRGPCRGRGRSGHPRRSRPDRRLVFGVYCAEEPIRTEDAPETASGVINIVPDLPQIRFAQTVVPAALDVGFGVLSRAPSGMVHDPVTITVTHPPFPTAGSRWNAGRTRLGWEDRSA
jgi:hypothetical protein